MTIAFRESAFRVFQCLEPLMGFRKSVSSTLHRRGIVKDTLTIFLRYFGRIFTKNISPDEDRLKTQFNRELYIPLRSRKNCRIARKYVLSL